MDARLFRPYLGVATLLLCTFCTSTSAQFGRRQQFVAHSQNFIVFASSAQWAKQVSEMAELNRRNLSIHWLGAELPPWSERVPIHVESSPTLGAGGETRFQLINGNHIGGWMMSVQGTQERILDSVLPHEITHTIFATHFAPLGKYVPRWADEGACTTVEHESEKQKHQQKLHEFLRTGYGLAFNRMFSLKEYPDPILPLYAQGHSAVQFLLDQGGPQKFVKFLESGMRSEVWSQALREHYDYDSIGQFQTSWNKWLADGSPTDLLAYAPVLQRGPAATPAGSVVLAANSRVLNDQDVISPPASTRASADFAADPLSIPRSEHSLGNESWYKRRLREVSGDGAILAVRTIPPQSPLPTSQSAEANAPVRQTVGHPLPVQSTGIQVLEWGDSVPVSGIQSRLLYTSPPTGKEPMYR